MLILIVIASALLVLPGLGHAAFWDDEAFVGITARTLVRTGHISVWDGRNLYAPRDSACYPSQCGDCNPPLDTILAAGSFKLLGITNTSGRLPFALATIATVIVFILALRLVAPSATALHVYAAAMLALSPGVLLYGRTCRYYAVAMLLASAIYLFYRRYIAAKRAGDLIALTVCVILLFYANYMLCAVFMLSLAMVHFAFHRETLRGHEWMPVGAAIAAILCATVPYVIASKALDFGYNGKPEPWLPHHLRLLWWNIRDLNLHAVLPWMASLALFAGMFYTARRKHETGAKEAQVWLAAREWLALVASFLVLLALVSPQPTDTPGTADIRYQVVILPFLAALSGVLLWALHRWMPTVAVALFVVMVGTNALTLTPALLNQLFPQTNTFRLLLPGYVQEITHPYPTANSMASDFLLQNARQDDTLLCDKDFEDYPLAFYVGDKIKLCGQLDYGSTMPQAVVRSLPAPLYKEENFPDWVIFFGAQKNAHRLLSFYSRPHLDSGRTVHRTYTLTQGLLVYYVQTQRPELPWHSFGPSPVPNPSHDGRAGLRQPWKRFAVGR
jgi:hypothetical protein